MSQSIAKIRLQDFLRARGAYLVMEYQGFEIWILEDKATIIRLEKGHKRVDIEIVEDILEQMGLSPWFLDDLLQ